MMRNLIVIAALMSLGACVEQEVTTPSLATSRFCDSAATYNVMIKNNSLHTIKAVYFVYIDTNRNKRIDPKDKMLYRSPILVFAPYEEKLPDPVPIDTLWNNYTLLTELQTTLGETVKDHLYPCERHVAQ